MTGGINHPGLTLRFREGCDYILLMHESVGADEIISSLRQRPDYNPFDFFKNSRLACDVVYQSSLTSGGCGPGGRIMNQPTPAEMFDLERAISAHRHVGGHVVRYMCRVAGIG